MNLARSVASRLYTLAGLVGMAVTCSSAAQAQGLTADPYQPYNAIYQDYMYASYPNGQGLYPNESVVLGRTGIGRANRFNSFVEGIEGSDRLDMSEGSGRRYTGPGMPYFSAYRQFDKDYNRVYQPNQDSDTVYYKDQKSRHEKYLEWLREKDPKRRAALYREYMQESRRASRDVNDARAANLRSRVSAAEPGAAAAPSTRRSSPAEATSRPTASEPLLKTRRNSGSSSASSGRLLHSPSDTLKRSDSIDRDSRSTSGARRSTSSTPPAPAIP